jgi:hypothetical protein
MDASGSSSVGTVPWVRVDDMEGGRQSKPTEDISSSKSSLEMQKVLQLILSRLRERARPPTIFGQLPSDTNKKSSIKVDVVVDSIRGAIRKTASPNQGIVEVDDDKGSPGFSTTPTLDLMTQLRDCLILSHKQGWDALPPRYALLPAGFAIFSYPFLVARRCTLWDSHPRGHQGPYHRRLSEDEVPQPSLSKAPSTMGSRQAI